MRRILVVAALLCACREKAAPPAPPAVSRPGPAPPGRVRGAGQPLALRIERKGVGTALLETYDRDRTPLVRTRAGGDDPGLVPALACVEACFIKVSGTGPQDYELTVLGSDPQPGEELEPNNRAVDATELQPGKPVRGTFLSSDDEDWFRLALPAGSTGVLRIE